MCRKIISNWVLNCSDKVGPKSKNWHFPTAVSVHPRPLWVVTPRAHPTNAREAGVRRKGIRGRRRKWPNSDEITTSCRRGRPSEHEEIMGGGGMGKKKKNPRGTGSGREGRKKRRLTKMKSVKGRQETT